MCAWTFDRRFTVRCKSRDSYLNIDCRLVSAHKFADFQILLVIHYLGCDYQIFQNSELTIRAHLSLITARSDLPPNQIIRSHKISSFPPPHCRRGCASSVGISLLDHIQSRKQPSFPRRRTDASSDHTTRLYWERRQWQRFIAHKRVTLCRSDKSTVVGR